jgi:hypothetical protein
MGRVNVLDPDDVMRALLAPSCWSYYSLVDESFAERE